MNFKCLVRKSIWLFVMLISTFSSVSSRILFNSFKLFPGITIFENSIFVSTGISRDAKRWLSVAVKFKTLSFSVKLTPVNIGLVSILETANTVCLLSFLISQLVIQNYFQFELVKFVDIL